MTSPPESELLHGDESTPNKRRRIALACSACRTRKSKCDGKRPKCALCKNFGFDCVYVQSTSSANVIVGKEYLSTLEDRVQSLEEIIDDFRRHIDQPSAGPSTTRNNSQTTPNNGHHQEEPDTMNDVIEGLTDVAGTELEESGFYGPSSNFAFLRMLSRVVAREKLVPKWAPPIQPWFPVVDRSKPSAAENSVDSPGQSQSDDGQSITDLGDLYALPSPEQTSELLHQYFAHINLLYPILHEESFLRTYREMAKGERDARPSYLALLNIVLALAQTSIYTPQGAQERMRQSQAYYERAVSICKRPPVRGIRLETIQCLILTGYYLQGTENFSSAWSTHCHAVNAACQIGLHSSNASQKLPPLEKELRKRAWYGSIMLDRTLCLTLGRPAVMPEFYIKLELPESYTNLQLSTSETESSGACFFNTSILLYKRLWNIVESLYGQNIGCDKPRSVEELAFIIAAEQKPLQSWAEGMNTKLTTASKVTAELKNSTISNRSDLQDRIPIILTLRYHNVRLLLHRPMVSKFLMAPQEEYDSSKLLRNGFESLMYSLESAKEIIEIVHNIVHAETERRYLMGSWWFVLYYTFDAALILFALVLIKEIAPYKSGLAISSSESKYIVRAIRALRLLDKGNVTVERCTSYLEQLLPVLNISMDDADDTSSSNGKSVASFSPRLALHTSTNSPNSGASNYLSPPNTRYDPASGARQSTSSTPLATPTQQQHPSSAGAYMQGYMNGPQTQQLPQPGHGVHPHQQQHVGQQAMEEYNEFLDNDFEFLSATRVAMDPRAFGAGSIPQ